MYCVVQPASSLIQGCGCCVKKRKKTPAETLRCSSWLEHTPLCWLLGGRETKNREETNLLSAALGCGRLWVQVQEHKFRPRGKALLPMHHGIFIVEPLQIHKAAACKWGKTSPKSWGSQEAPAQRRAGTAEADVPGKFSWISTALKSVHKLWSVHCFYKGTVNKGTPTDRLLLLLLVLRIKRYVICMLSIK